MLKRFSLLFITSFIAIFISCSSDDDAGSTTIISEGLATVVFSGDITNEAAVEIVKNDIGRNTNTILVQNTRNLTSLNLLGLETALDIQVFNNDKLENIEFPDLRETYGNISFNNNDALTSIKMNSLTEATSISFRSLISLVSISLENLKILNGSFSFRNCHKTKEISLPNLEVINNGLIEFRDNNLLQKVELVKLQKVVGPLTIRDNSKFENLSLPSLKQLATLSFVNTIATSIQLPELETLVGNLTITGNESLTDIFIPKLKAIKVPEDPEIEINSIFSIATNPLLKEINFLELEGTIRATITGNTSLTKISFPKVNGYESGDFRITEENLTEVNFNALTTTRDFLVTSKVELNSIKLSKISEFRTIQITDAIATEVDKLLANLVANVPSERFGTITLQGTESAESVMAETTLEERGLRVTINP